MNKKENKKKVYVPIVKIGDVVETILTDKYKRGIVTAIGEIDTATGGTPIQTLTVRTFLGEEIMIRNKYIVPFDYHRWFPKWIEQGLATQEEYNYLKIGVYNDKA